MILFSYSTGRRGGGWHNDNEAFAELAKLATSQHPRGRHANKDGGEGTSSKTTPISQSQSPSKTPTVVQGRGGGAAGSTGKSKKKGKQQKHSQQHKSNNTDKKEVAEKLDEEAHGGPQRLMLQLLKNKLG